MMGRPFTITVQSLASSLILMMGLNLYGCSDSASVNPVVELAGLTITSGTTPATLQPSFSPATTNYTVDLSTNLTSVTVTAQPAVAGDSVTINGEATTSRLIPLGGAGTTTPVNIVVSESGTNSRTYTILLTKANLTGNNSLRSLSISTGSLNPRFNADTLGYEVAVASTVNSMRFTPTVDDPAATVTVNGQPAVSGQPLTITLNGPGQPTTIPIIVTAPNGSQKPYTVNVIRAALGGNNSLSALTISPGTLNPAFSANTLSYEASVASNVTNIRVTPTVDDSAATMTVNGQPATSGQAQTIPLNDPGLSTILTTVVAAPNNSQKTYTVNVIRAALGGNNNLQSLTVSPSRLDPAFSASRTSYTVSVGGRVDSITLTAAAQDTNARMTISGQETRSRSIPLPAGPSSTDIQVIVTAPNGIPKTYFITVNRAALSADNNLEALSVSPGTLAPPFSAGTTQYTVEVATGVTSVGVTATKSDPNAVISEDIPNGGQANIPLDGPGTSKNVSIIVTAPNGTSKTYSITVNRLAPSTDSNLANLTVSAGTLNPGFSSGTLTYTVTVPAGVDSLIATATKSDPNAVMSASGSVIAATGIATGSVSRSLGLGTTTVFTITVIAQDGVNTRPYTINVFRDSR